MTESGAQLFARLEARRCLKDIEPRLFPEDGGPNHGEVVELYGAEGTGKTEMLYHLLCRCVLPVVSGGLEVDVVFVDTDYSLDMLRLVSILDNRLNSARSPSAGSDEAALRSCLSRLLVVHCSSSAQLLLTLHFLETTLSSRPGLALLLIDSISAFYWLDRSEGGASFSRQEERLSKCAELLGRLLRDYRITVFATCHAIRRRSHSGPPSSSESDRPFLCRPWQRLVTHRLVCSSRQEAPNNNNMAAAAGSSKEQRTRQVFTVRTAASYNAASSNAASSNAASSSSNAASSSSSSRTKTYRSSSFYVTDGGVEFI
ncbi:DNA repair protein XRCC2 [Labrus mixtus]|uniref:DNA repair protein XRCC2 n=1 Tax=Labrus mixtus TaxID=508554 RepID=UPI0029C0DA4D|nr:DNA repair protein XRCC2 [Labrus mixtus]